MREHHKPNAIGELPGMATRTRVDEQAWAHAPLAINAMQFEMLPYGEIPPVATLALLGLLPYGS